MLLNSGAIAFIGEPANQKGHIVFAHRMVFASLLAIGALSTLLVPVASAQGTARYERCAVQSPDTGTVIVAYALDNQAAVELAAAQCGYLISTGNYVAATNHVGLLDNPAFDHVCKVEFSGANSINVFSRAHLPSSYYAALVACGSADDGSGFVTYD